MPSKYYVVWKGKVPGIYDNWEKCKSQVEGFRGAKYKSFLTAEEAKIAFSGNPEDYFLKVPSPMAPVMESLYGRPLVPSIAVDGACNGKTKDAEYQGVDVESKIKIFHCGPLKNGTNNVMEFLAIVHAIAYCHKNKITCPTYFKCPIYSDSAVAIKWVRQKKAATKLESLPDNARIFDLIQRAETWLKTHTYENPILKWETQAWGEIPADFGRK